MGKGRSKRKRHQRKMRKHEEKMVEVFGQQHSTNKVFTEQTVKDSLKKSAANANELRQDLKNQFRIPDTNLVLD